MVGSWRRGIGEGGHDITDGYRIRPVELHEVDLDEDVLLRFAGALLGLEPGSSVRLHAEGDVAEGGGELAVRVRLRPDSTVVDSR